MKNLLTLVIFAILLVSSCLQDEESKYSISSSKLTFSKTDLSYGAAFHWDECKVSTFVEYIITINSEPTPAFNKISDLKSNTIFARIKSKDNTSISDTTTIENSYYRLYVNIGNGLLVSNEVFVDFLNFSLAGQHVANSLVDHINGNLYLLYSNRLVEVVDLKNMKSKVKQFEQAFNFNFSPSLGYDKFGKTEIYLPINDKIIFFDGENLEAKDTLLGITKGASIYNTATDKFNNIYYTDSYSGTLAVVAKYNPSTGKTIRFGDVLRNFMLRVTPDGKNVVVATQDIKANVSLYTFNDKDVIISNIKSLGAIDFSSNSFFTFASSGAILIGGKSGNLFERRNDQLVRMTTLNPSGIEFFSSEFSADEKFIYFTSFMEKLVVKVHNSNPYNKVTTFKTRFLPLHFFVYNNEGYAVTFVTDPFTGFDKLVLEKIKL
jgi:hypothetical protein